MTSGSLDPRLALGTVQFGVAYGVAGRGIPVPEDEVAAILRRAWNLGVRTLDTAAAYGSIESRLDRLMGDLDFHVVSKLPALPQGISTADTVSAALQAFERARQHLGPRLKSLMFHQAVDLTMPSGAAVWRAIHPLAQDNGIALGVSCYDPETLAALARRFAIEVAQLPGNALDQRVRTHGLQEPAQIHLRSLFLQGLLLMPLEQARARVPAATEGLERWHAWCNARSLQPLEAALGVVKAWPAVSRYVFGVDSLHQLDEIAQAWQTAQPMDAPELDTPVPDAIDPRRWPAPKAA